MKKHFEAYWLLLQLMNKHKKAIFLCAFLGALGILANIALLSASALLISRAALATSIMELFVLVAGVRFFGIFRAFLRYLERLISHSITLSLLSKLRVQIYTLICPLVPGAMGQKSSQLFKNLLSDIETLKYFYLRVINVPLISVLVWIAVSSFLWFYEPLLALLFAVSYLIAALLLPILAQVYLKGKSAAKDSLRLELNIKFQDYILGAADLANSGNNERYLADVSQQRQKLIDAEAVIMRLDYLSNSFNNLLANITLFIALVLASSQVNNGSLNGVYLAMLVICLWSAFEGVQALPIAFAYAQESRQAAENIVNLKQTSCVERNISQGTLPQNGHILFEKVSFHYPNQPNNALENISFEIADGEHIAIVGASASGKSTIVQLLLGFQCQQSGIIKIGGVDLAQLSAKDLTGQISVLSQNSYIFSASIKENLLLAKPNAAEDELWQALQKAGLADFAHSLPDGLNTQLYQNGSNLSGGQKQRLALARMFLQEGKIIIVDEALKGLDYQNAREIERAIQDFAQKRTLIAITHDLKYLKNYGRIMVLKDNKLLAFAPLAELLRQCSYFGELYKLEMSRLEL